MIKKIIRYGVGGGIGAIVDLAFLWVFTEIVGFHYLISAIFSFCISFFVGFFFQKYITFECKQNKHLAQGFLFLIFQLIGLLINLLLLWIFVDHFHFDYMYVSVFNKIIIFGWNFLMNYLYNFKTHD